MFAFAIWDPTREELLLVRDRMGIKPLFYYPTPDGVLFGSEPKAILAHPAASASVDADGLREILAFVKTPGHAGFRGMYEVRPGDIAAGPAQGLADREYWRLDAREHTDDLPTTIAHVSELLDDIVERQLVADVPLCTLLSGGLDSSVITALAAARLASRSAGPCARSPSTSRSEPELPGERPPRHVGHPVRARAGRHVGADHTDVVLDTAELLDPAAVRRAARPRLADGLGEGDTSLYLLFRRSGSSRRSRCPARQRTRCSAATSGSTTRGACAPTPSRGSPPVRRGLRRPRRDPRLSFLDPDLLRKLDLPATSATATARRWPRCRGCRARTRPSGACASSATCT